MVLFELVVALLFIGALLALWAERIGVPYPALLALVGALLALVPGAPDVVLDPELALALFVAPTLLDAAYDASPRDLRHNLAPLVSFAVVMVVLTVAAVAWAVRQIVPEMGWAAAIALGAIVAPPDASAATAVLRKLQPPHRVLVILEGESLFNDATSLLIYRVAVGAAVTGSLSGWDLVPRLVLTCGGGVLTGWAFARLYVPLTRSVENIPIHVLLQFLGTFSLWIIAEDIGVSAIITLVAFAMTLARRGGGLVHARRRITAYAVWDVAVLVLNVLAFVLIGLQLRGILARVHGEQWRTYAACAATVCATVILVRIVWVQLYILARRWRMQHRAVPSPLPLPSLRNGWLASWCGMRGIVTLAAALALPDGPNPFPYRDLILFASFCVVLSTLVLQGLTLRPLMQWLGLHDDGTVERESDLARAEIARAALRALDGRGVPPPLASLLRREYQARLHLLETHAARTAAPQGEATFAAVQRRAVQAQREALMDLRARHVIGDDAFHRVEEEIDLLDLTADLRVQPLSEDPAGA